MVVPLVTTPKERRFKYCLNLGWFFTDKKPVQRIKLAKQVGFNAVELFWPGANLSSLPQTLSENAMTVAMLNMYEGNYAAGDRGFLCYPNRVVEWKTMFLEALEACTLLNCPLLNVLTGNVPEGMSYSEAQGLAIRTLKWATPFAQERGIRLVIEPLNHITHPRYLCQRTSDVIRLISHLDTSVVGVEYDLYHAQTSEGNLMRTIDSNIESIYHIQLADCPSRQAPGTGEINFPNVISELVKLNYDGFVGLEFTPSGTAQDFDWLPFAERGR
jgi:hydroxypyruvate isomerase